MLRQSRRLEIGAQNMWNRQSDPSCSFCGSRTEHLVRAGGRDYWICGGCIDCPVIADSLMTQRCTFCEQPLSVTRPAVAARRGTVLCRDCLPVCIQLLDEARQRRA